MRETTGVKAGISKVVQGVHDRILTVSGSLEDVSKAYTLIAQTLLNNPSDASVNLTIATIKLLISHNLMGTVIGRQGAKIKLIQDTCGVRMIASKTLLPQSTERVVEVRGTVEAIHKAILEIGQCLIEYKERAYGTILYNPTKVGNNSDPHSTNRNPDLNSFEQLPNHPNIHTQSISIPSDMVGCIIGKGGAKISEIRRLSGSNISIAQAPHDESGERMFTIQGTSEANERALYLLYNRLENEKERRLKAHEKEY